MLQPRHRCRAGSLDLSLWVLHTDSHGHASFDHDRIEPLRPIVNPVMLEWVAGHSFRMNHDFILLREGLCRLGIELAAEVGKAVSDRLREEAEKVVTEVRSLLRANPSTAEVIQRRALRRVRNSKPFGRRRPSSAAWRPSGREAPASDVACRSHGAGSDAVFTCPSRGESTVEETR
jgi:hypothetical protein